MLAGVMIGTEAESGRRVSELPHTESCQDRLDAHLHLYSTLAWTSIAITLIMGFGSRMIVKRIMDGRILAAARAWRVLAYASFLAGAAKFLLGLILLSMIGGVQVRGNAHAAVSLSDPVPFPRHGVALPRPELPPADKQHGCNRRAAAV
eukprot:scaffold65438_cov72-Phaeocystis_antarctica.AAC.3